MVSSESGASTIGHITLDKKQTGAPSAGNLHAGCDVAGAGNGFTVELVRHRQTKETEQIGFTYGTPRQSSTLHLLGCLAIEAEMGRKPRVEFEGALYHVIVRGNIDAIFSGTKATGSPTSNASSIIESAIAA